MKGEKNVTSNDLNTNIFVINYITKKYKILLIFY